MKEIVLGTIGSGVIVRSVLDAVQRTEGIRLAAVYSRSGEKGRELAAEYGAEKVYTDLDSLFADGEINCVYVASPNSLHYEQAKTALLAGKHVICEKPLCPRADQVRELAALAGEKGLFLVGAAPTMFLPNYGILKRELPKVGRVKLVQGSYCQYSSRYDRLLRGEVANVFSPRFAGGCLMDINFYNVYLTVALFGAPEKAVYHANIYNDLVDTSGIMVMDYDGFAAQATGAKDTWGVNAFQISGEQGYIYIEGGSNGLAGVKVVTKDGEVCFNEQPDPDRWYYEVQTVTKLMLSDDHAAIEQALDVMADTVEVIETARRTAGILFPGD